MAKDHSTTRSADRHSPVLGGLLVGGRSRRMGRPKATLVDRGTALGERVAAALRPHVAELLLLGQGPVPPSLEGLERLPDAPLPPADGSLPIPTAGRTAGPLAGILAALRARPGAAWVICPCDLPAIEPAAVAWLLGQRRPGRAAVLPRAAAAGPPEPLFALYEPAALVLAEGLAAEGARAPRRLASLPGVATVTVPPSLAHCWRDADTPADLAG